jgi:hypothetical protein
LPDMTAARNTTRWDDDAMNFYAEQGRAERISFDPAPACRVRALNAIAIVKTGSTAAVEIGERHGGADLPGGK